MHIYSVNDPEFKSYGNVWDDVPSELTLLVLEALSATPIPEGSKYVASAPELESVKGADKLGFLMFGGRPFQLGWCNGHNTRLNCLEYHRASEFNLGARDFILLVAHRWEIEDGKLTGRYLGDIVDGKRKAELLKLISAAKVVLPADGSISVHVTFSLIDEEKAYAGVIVPDDQLSLAIGKEGQNARLAARLTGWHIDIKSETLAADILKNVPVHEEPAADLIGDEEDEDVRRCEYVSEDGIQCRNQARPGSRFCGVHDTDAFDDAEDLI